MANISIIAANFIPSAAAVTQVVTANQTLTRGMVASQDTDGGYLATAADDTDYEADGLVCEDVDAGQKFLLLKSDPALAIGATVASGTILIWSTSAGGGICPAADAASTGKVVVLAVGLGGNLVNFKPLTGGVKP